MIEPVVPADRDDHTIDRISAPRSRRSLRWWRRHGVVVLCIAVAAVQLYLQHARQLTRWKGGGFGMYSEIHFTYRELWIRDGDDAYSLFHETAISDSGQREEAIRQERRHFDRCMRWTTHACLAERAEGDGRTFEIWELTVDTESLEMRRRLLARYRGRGR